MSPAQTAPVSLPEVNAVQGPPPLVRLRGAWDIRALQYQARALRAALRVAAAAISGPWDLSQVQRLDHSGALLIWQAWGKRRPERVTIRPEHEPLFESLARSSEPVSPPGFRPVRAFLALGKACLAFLDHLASLLALLGQTLLDSARMLRHPSTGPWREVSAATYRAGAQALPITAGVGFLIGVVLSYLSSEQLKTLGANVFIVNILGIGLIRELGPVLCAVLVAGRSGSAITAQLGVMRVTEELDALAVMGIRHTVRLVLPRILALALALPLLVVWTTGLALIGGALAAQYELGISVHQFLTSLPSAVPAVNLAIGVGKGVLFGVLIALVACHFGLRIEPNTESLGAGTTRSVVSSITVVIIADAIIAVLFHDVGIKLL